MNNMTLNPFRYPVHAWKPIENPENPPSLEEAKKLWVKNKVIPPHLEDVLYETLRHYPELKETYLIVVETQFYGVQHSLRSYPPLLSLPNKRADRVYPIVFNTNKKIPNGFYALSGTEQKGILAHELAHILDYTKRTSPQIIGFAFTVWLSKKFIRDIEHATDKTAIMRNCGDYLLAYREKALDSVSPRLKMYLETIYLKPGEIVAEEKANHLPTQGAEVIRKPPGAEKKTGKPKIVEGIFYSLVTALSFFPAIIQMMYLVWIRNMHKKPNWYKRKTTGQR